MEQAHAAIMTWVRAKKKSWVLSVNPLTVQLAHKNKLLTENLNSASMSIPDGIGTVWAIRLLHGLHAQRVTGIDIIERLLREKGLRFFLFGSAPGIADLAAQRIKASYPGAVVCGTQHGFISPHEEAGLLARIRLSKPHILVVCLGQPKQEEWILRHWPDLPRLVALPLGGSLDVLSGAVKRAPRLFRSLGLEWSYRILSDPRRTMRLIPLAGFTLRVLYHSFQNARRPKYP